MTILMASYVHRWGNHPREWSTEQFKLLHLGAETANKIYKHVQDYLEFNVWVA
jgi:hypothetical protein